MDISLGTINLTGRQRMNSETLKNDFINGFAFNHETNEVFVISKRDLSDGEKQDLISALQALPVNDWAPGSEKDKRKQRKKSILQKMNLNKNDIQSLIELLQDGNDE